MLNAKEIMTRDVICITPETKLKDAVKVLVENKVSGTPVCDAHGAVVGVISERDIINFIFSGNVENTTVREAMSTNILSFPSDTPIDKISLAMCEKQVRRVPVIDNGKLVGIISRRSILRTVLDIPKGQHQK